ncbi:alpha/beta-hydrolase [Sphaerulina musiva SO2202]|uniref:Alpha/beta-hydrolase n=1 Tax=Sphaerulina musiva (strain SO2202) TaxID=692275 RepID=M3C3G1_SPHMS|nr:alpha/beta-hydrolase [Sphaerulina musiva SO2202]EMF14811.1 alpha/beta-hydrolase [Sphaerulina musiva SO2202]
MENYRIIKHKIPAAHLREFPQATLHSEEDILHLAVNQYIPLNNPHPQPGDVTIIAAHAVGYHKELYEPLWDELAAQARFRGWRIRSIWMADVAWHGESYQMNEELVGNSPGWYDHSRDLANLINLRREEMVRPIVGVGHSMGGNQITKLALDHPSLFTTLILLDPVIQMKSAEIDPSSQVPSAAQASTFRRDHWPSREIAHASFLKSPYYQTWDKRVLEKWVKFGLRDCEDEDGDGEKGEKGEKEKGKGVCLATPSAQEVWSFLRPNYPPESSSEEEVPSSSEQQKKQKKKLDRFLHPDLNPSLPNQTPFYRSEPITTYLRLPELRPGCLYIFGQLSFVCDKSTACDKVSRTGIGAGGSGGEAEGRVGGVTLEGVGHLIAMEAPGKTAEVAAEWIKRELEGFGERRRRLEEGWWRRERRERQRVDGDWKRFMGGPPVRGRKKGGEAKM